MNAEGLAQDDFQLFELPRRFALDRGELDARRRALQAEVHPDRFASAGPAGRRLATQWAVRVNEAYARLKDPLRRAAYLCEIGGVPIRAEDNTAMPPDFLVRQMQWREALDDAASRDDVATVDAEVAIERREALERLGQAIDDRGDLVAAAREARALMFVERFAESVEEKLSTFATEAR